MNQVFEQKTQEKPRILVAPLDWGLGHTTRCIPIIRELLVQNCTVLLAGNDRQAALLAVEFPSLEIIPLDGYNINYAKSATGMLKALFLQVPKILLSVRKEQQWLQSVCKEYNISVVISDNRYGLYHSSIPCVLITHQLLIKSTLGKWAENILQKINYRLINRFTGCWVPDAAGENNLAGELSHPARKPGIPLKYIGLLSRLEKKEIPVKKNHLFIMLSGPEPLRGIMEEKIIKDISHYPGSATIVRGLPGTTSLMPSTNMLKFYNHLSAEELAAAMMEAEFVICRSGYSSLMDIIALQKKSIIIPTPGQTEQEYLGKYLADKKMAVCISQKNFSLEEVLAVAKNTNYQFIEMPEKENLKKTIEQFLHQPGNTDLG